MPTTINSEDTRAFKEKHQKKCYQDVEKHALIMNTLLIRPLFVSNTHELSTSIFPDNACGQGPKD